MRARVSPLTRQHLRPLATAPKLNWKTLGFDFTPTSSMLIYNWKDGAWDKGQLKEDFTLNIHALSNALHYGQAIFEGLKAFHCKDGMVRVFNSRPTRSDCTMAPAGCTCRRCRPRCSMRRWTA